MSAQAKTKDNVNAQLKLITRKLYIFLHLNGTDETCPKRADILLDFLVVRRVDCISKPLNIY
jgi:hypothetical protein